MGDIYVNIYIYIYIYISLKSTGGGNKPMTNRVNNRNGAVTFAVRPLSGQGVDHGVTS